MPMFFLPAPMPVEELREILGYDPETGRFWWRQRQRRPRTYFDRQPGYIDSKGYRYIMIAGSRHCAHRLAWYLVHGTWPPNHIDHKNEIKGDNRIDNLRPATDTQNKWNTTNRNPTSGYRGVIPHGKRWQARLRIDRCYTYLGTFDSPEEAYTVVCDAIQAIRGEFARTD
jgi:hypothetical protein